MEGGEGLWTISEGLRPSYLEKMRPITTVKPIRNFKTHRPAGDDYFI